MGNVLEFSLGLATGGFTQALAGADSSVKSFVGSLLGLGAVTAGVMKAFETGAGLYYLSKRTGESVGNLYALQKVFKAVGLSAESVAPAIFQMQKALGGFNEMGEPTKNIFAGLGLDVAKLKGMDTPKQIEAITAAFGKLTKEEAAIAAVKIYGRASAGDMLQAARSSKDFAAGLQAASGPAQTMAKNARTFRDIEESMDRIKGKTIGLFAGIAEGVAPALKKVLGMLEKIDLSGIGKGIGRYLNLLASAFQNGYLMNVVMKSVAVGIQSGVILALPALQLVGAAILQACAPVMNYIYAAMQMAIDRLANNPLSRALMDAITGGVNSTVWKTLGVQSGSNSLMSYDDWVKSVKKDGGAEYGSIGGNANRMAEDVKASLASALAKIKEITAPLDTFAKEIQRLNRTKEEKDTAGTGTLGTGLESGGGGKPQVSNLEKMGFVFDGGGSAMSDDARRTADNTAKTNDLLKRFIDGIPKGGAVNFENIV